MSIVQNPSVVPLYWLVSIDSPIALYIIIRSLCPRLSNKLFTSLYHLLAKLLISSVPCSLSMKCAPNGFGGCPHCHSQALADCNLQQSVDSRSMQVVLSWDSTAISGSPGNAAMPSLRLARAGSFTLTCLMYEAINL